RTPSSTVFPYTTLFRSDNGFIRLRVQDSGPGISPEHLPLIFDRFYKADAARAAGDSGSGLGLSIVKAIVERHGGRVTASNAPERSEEHTSELQSRENLV